MKILSRSTIDRDPRDTLVAATPCPRDGAESTYQVKNAGTVKGGIFITYRHVPPISESLPTDYRSGIKLREIMFKRDGEEVPCMGMIKRTIVGQQKTQTVAYVALGVSIIALIVVFGMKGANK